MQLEFPQRKKEKPKNRFLKITSNSLKLPKFIFPVTLKLSSSLPALQKNNNCNTILTNFVYFFYTFAENKRKSDDNLENSTAKTKRMETKLRCTDLIVLGLPWKTTEQNLREYFETFGEVLMAQVRIFLFKLEKKKN